MRIKTKLLTLLKPSLILLAFVCLSSNAHAKVFQVNGIYYSINEEDSTTVSVATSEEIYDEEIDDYVQVHHNVSGNVTIPSTVSYNGFTFTVIGIESRAFSGITALTDISIPESVTEIGTEAFTETGLWERQHGIVYADTWVVGCKDDLPGDTIIKEGTIGIANHAFDMTVYYNPFINLIIPNSVLYVGDGAFVPLFGFVSPIKHITIGKNVKHIGAGAFYTGSYCWYSGNLAGDVELQSITCLATVPPRTASGNYADGAFAGWNEYSYKHGGWTEIYEDNDYAIYDKVPLYVPSGSVQAYKEADDWCRFKTIIGISVSDIYDVNGDNEITISDINSVIEVIILGSNHPNYNNCDVDGDGEVTIADIKAQPKKGGGR